MEAYYILDKISPAARNILTILLIFTGYLFQIASRNILTGLPFIIGGLLLNLVRNFSLKPIRPTKLEWKEVTPDKINQVEAHCRRLLKLRGGNWGCVAIFFLIFFFIFLLPIIKGLFPSIRDEFAIFAVVVDSIILFVGLVVCGRRSVWIPNDLDVKIPIIKRMLNLPLLKNDPEIRASPYLEVGETKNGSFPNDVKIFVTFKNAPGDFIGVQGQISINNVKDNRYPYFYCVIIAKPSFGIGSRIKDTGLKNVTIEYEANSDAEVIIIRQTTTRTSGYHTNQNTQDYILSNSIAIAKKILSG